MALLKCVAVSEAGRITSSVTVNIVRSLDGE